MIVDASRPAAGTLWLPQVAPEGVVQTKIKSPCRVSRGLVP